MTENNDIEIAKLQHQVIGAEKCSADSGFVRNPHPESQWFKDAGLGLFIHFGISTVSSEIDLSWGMIKDKPWDNYSISPDEYFALAKDFNPVNFNPEKWLSEAKQAGFKYAVFTTRHHDGFALWPSKLGDYNISKYGFERDLVGEYVDACRKCGLKVGLYYSPPDWHYNRNYMSFAYSDMKNDCTFDENITEITGTNHKPVKLQKKPDNWDKEYKAYVRGQIEELMQNYGKIDILWFDGGSELWDAISIEEIRELQPAIIVNPRMHSHGDFETFECRLPEKAPCGWWEHEDIWAEGPWWAYMKQSKSYKSALWFADEYKKVREMGGNFLINVGPMSDGSMPEDVYVRFSEIKELLNK
ncbi:MAG: alpha-L-fucosidase [Clostridia bacterium]|nr:alpha-L-fucosidase [Clostridia bacterium]